MANILVCADGFFRAISPLALEPLIEGFVESLVKNGNNVLLYIKKDFPEDKSLSTKLLEFKATKEVKTFNPEIIFTFNNCIRKSFLQVTNCPVYIIASDTPVYWNRGSLIEKFNSRYHLLYFNDDFCEDVKNLYKIGFEKQQRIPYVTAINANPKLPKKYDISFIGNFYNVSQFLFENIIYELHVRKDEKTYNEFCELVDDIIISKKKTSNIQSKWQQIKDKIGKNRSLDLLIKEVFLMKTSDIRQSYLSKISDMDLHIFTWIQNLRISSNNFNLAKSTHILPIYDIKGNEKIYNSSVISLTLPHAQVDTGFSWRVCDILASNSMLLSNPSKDLDKIFNGIIPVYKDPSSLRDLCKYYIKNSKERTEIVSECQRIIDKNCRYDNFLDILYDFTKINFKNCQNIGKLINFKSVETKQNKYFAINK